jgi:hypothetical protein
MQQASARPVRRRGGEPLALRARRRADRDHAAPNRRLSRIDVWEQAVPAWERNLKSQNILLLGLASLIFGCEGPVTSDEAGLLDAVAFVTGGQQEGTMPQGFETRWRLRAVIEGKAWMCNDGRCQDNTAIAISASRQEDLPRVIKSKRHAIEFIKKACPGMPH